VSFVVLMSVMALVWKPWHVLALRAVQGVFAGYGALCLAMAADSAPPGRFAQSIGMVQTAQRLGPALGPVLGGIVAGSVGLRTSFYVTAVFYAAALTQLVVLYREPPAVASDGSERLERVTFRNVLVFENFMLVMGLIFAFQFVDRSFGPVLPLHVAHLGTPEGRVAFVSGLLFSLIACAAAGGHHVCARLLDEWPVRTVITRATLLAGGAAIVFVAADSLWLLAIACVVFGFGIGVATTAAYTVAATVVPGHARGAGFGLLTSSSLIGMALSPIVSGFVGATGIRFVFAADAAVLAAVAIAVRRLMIDTSAASAGPVNEDA
jgi:DHA1 family multidrug resistance protein-like MFS transporter